MSLRDELIALNLASETFVASDGMMAVNMQTNEIAADKVLEWLITRNLGGDAAPAVPQFRFTMRRVARRSDPYYYTNWDNSRDIEVVAADEPAAFKKLWAMSGAAPSGREWTARLISVKEESK